MEVGLEGCDAVLCRGHEVADEVFVAQWDAASAALETRSASTFEEFTMLDAALAFAATAELTSCTPSSVVKETAMPERKSHGRFKVGVELTDEVLDRMADQVEEGLDITRCTPARPRPGGQSRPGPSYMLRAPTYARSVAADSGDPAPQPERT